jgi:hypothetical protein
MLARTVCSRQVKNVVRYCSEMQWLYCMFFVTLLLFCKSILEATNSAMSLLGVRNTLTERLQRLKEESLALLLRNQRMEFKSSPKTNNPEYDDFFDEKTIV